MIVNVNYTLKVLVREQTFSTQFVLNLLGKFDCITQKPRTQLSLRNYIKYKGQCFIAISKHQEESLKYDAHWSILDEIWGVWIGNETLYQVFDITSQKETKTKK